MKTYLSKEKMLSASAIQEMVADCKALKEKVRGMTISLSVEERKGKRKMGNRRMAYAQTAERIGRQYERLLPRSFDPAEFTNVLEYWNRISELYSQIAEIHEMLDDTLMASGIDAMAYTKLVHDGIRAANSFDPSADFPLRELDEFNSRAQNEEEENPQNPENPA